MEQQPRCPYRTNVLAVHNVHDNLNYPVDPAVLAQHARGRFPEA